MTSTNFNRFKAYFYKKNDFSDLAECQKLDEKFFAWPWDKKEWPLLNEKKESYQLYTLEDCGRILGMSLYYLPPKDNLAHLLKIIIHPEYQGLGLAHKLLGRNILDLKRIGRNQFYLEVECDNNRAVELYKKHGFEILCTKKNFYGNLRHAWAMKLALTSPRCLEQLVDK